MREKPWQLAKEHLMVRIRVTPNARKNALGGLRTAADGSSALHVHVSVPPEKGKANKAAIAILAKALGVPRSAISVTMGETSRNKTLSISAPFGHALEALERIMEKHENG